MIDLSTLLDAWPIGGDVQAEEAHGDQRQVAVEADGDEARELRRRPSQPVGGYAPMPLFA